MLRRRVLGPLLLVCPLFAACGGDGETTAFYADVSGTYTVALTNRSVTGDSASCPFRNSEPGEMAVGIRLDVTQDADVVTGTVSDAGSALILGLVVGTNVFEGTVSGSSVQMVANGTIPHNESGCAYFINATLNGSISGDALSGTVDYAPSTNDAAECAALSCGLRQEFSGSRPPRN